MHDHWPISPTMHHEMAQIARQLRRIATASESVPWEALRGRQIDGVRFRRQQPIGPFVVDSFAAAPRMIVEIDGPSHLVQRQADQRRHELLESLGLRIVRVASAEVETDLKGVLEKIRQALNPHPLPPLP